MDNADAKKLEVLLTAKKFPEAKKLLESFFLGDLTPKEKAAAHLNFAEIYMRVMNQISGEYRAALEEVADMLEKVNAKEKEVHGKIKLREVRQNLAA